MVIWRDRNKSAKLFSIFYMSMTIAALVGFSLIYYLELMGPEIVWIILILLISLPIDLFMIYHFILKKYQKNHILIGWFNELSLNKLKDSVETSLANNKIQCSVTENTKTNIYPLIDIKYLYDAKDSGFQLGLFSSEPSKTSSLLLIYDEYTKSHIIDNIKSELEKEDK